MRGVPGLGAVNVNGVDGAPGVVGLPVRTAAAAGCRARDSEMLGRRFALEGYETPGRALGRDWAIGCCCA